MPRVYTKNHITESKLLLRCVKQTPSFLPKLPSIASLKSKHIANAMLIEWPTACCSVFIVFFALMPFV